MSNPILAIATAVALLGIPANAEAQTGAHARLSIKRARHAVIAREHARWRGERVRMRFPACHRLSASSVECPVRLWSSWVMVNGSPASPSWATLREVAKLAHGRVTVRGNGAELTAHQAGGAETSAPDETAGIAGEPNVYPGPAFSMEEWRAEMLAEGFTPEELAELE